MPSGFDFWLSFRFHLNDHRKNTNDFLQMNNILGNCLLSIFMTRIFKFDEFHVKFWFKIFWRQLYHSCCTYGVFHRFRSILMLYHIRVIY